MEPLKYDEVTIFSDPARDVHIIEWEKRKLFQIRIDNAKIHIKINGLKVFKTMEIDGIEIACGKRICQDCLLKYGEKIKARKSLLGWWYYCPLCMRKNV